MAADAAGSPALFVLSRARASALTGGSWLGAADSVAVRGASLDSRSVQPGNLFACFVGARADGHDYAPEAVAKGAALVLASRPLTLPVPVLVVDDVAQALARLAAAFRAEHDDCCWLAVAGANGKTTTTRLLAAALRGGGARVHATDGNRNNHLGVPLCVLALPADATHAVIEIGTNHPGELAPLAGLVRPRIAVVASLGPEHLAGFGDLAGVAREECSAFASLPPDGLALLGVHGLDEECAAHGEDPQRLLAIARAAAGSRRLLLSGEAPPELAVRLLGAHQRANAWLALQAALAAGAEEGGARRALAEVEAAPGRLRPLRIGAHLLIDDCYNANPASMCAGLRVLAEQGGRRLAILGHMGELGAASAAGHARVGRCAAALGCALLAVGEAARPILEAFRAAGGQEGQAAQDHEQAARLALAWLAAAPGCVLVKGSRSARLELVLERLCAGLGAPWPGGLH
ncbi:MAG: UDP-N-acetylmuramoyl-tripeptide--D-alanyl-D-alanine ligase [Planctomycetota bacterium]|nr:UDP-N-acetylmuramoyl-tripeptide--D-alanyl-D-alanine ligase [Planctomycetota bacterium]